MADKLPWLATKKTKRIRTSIYDRYQRNPDRNRFYHSKEWKEFRLTILLRDLYTCQRCKGQGNEVDHIEPLGDDLSRALDSDNCQTLCRPCHNKKRKEERKLES